MTETRKTGVDGAIGLLTAMARGERGGKVLRMAMGLPRASGYRVWGDLEAAGIVSVEGREIRPGAVAAALIARHRGSEAVVPQGLRSGVPEGPVRLSAPPVLRWGKRLRIGFSNASMHNIWRVALVHSVEHAAAALGDAVDWFSVRQAEDSAERQAEDIAALVEAGADGIVVSTVDSAAAAEPVAEAMRRGVSVVLVDRGVAEDVPQTSFVTGDDFELGRLTALWLAETLGGRGGVVMLPGREDAEPAQRRLAAAREVFATFPGIVELGMDWTEWRRDRGRGAMDRAVARWGSRIAGVWCDSGLQGVGSLEAFVAAGMPIPPHTGGDLNFAYKLAIRHKVKLAAVDYPPQMGARALEILHQSLSGRWVARKVSVPSAVIVTRGHASRSVKPDRWAESHVRWDLPDDLVLGSGLGPAYNPRSFRIHYPGNRYNRSAARAGR
jgi:ribose transport system substrate-binding protein